MSKTYLNKRLEDVYVELFSITRELRKVDSIDEMLIYMTFVQQIHRKARDIDKECESFFDLQRSKK
jgi:hypothetical protein